MEVAWDKGQPKIPAHIAKLRCMAFADQQGWIWRQDGLNERAVKKHVLQRSHELGLRFEQDALEQFCASVPPDAQAIENELRKQQQLQARLSEEVSEKDARIAGQLREISAATGVTVRSMEELNAAQAAGTLVFSEAEGRFILGHYPEDFARACRGQLG